jgi:hypothetical protein
MPVRLGLVGTDRTDGWTNRFAANQNTVTGRDNPPDGFARVRVLPQGIVVHALLDLEGSQWFAWVRRLVNVCRHKAI